MGLVVMSSFLLHSLKSRTVSLLVTGSTARPPPAAGQSNQQCPNGAGGIEHPTYTHYRGAGENIPQTIRGSLSDQAVRTTSCVTFTAALTALTFQPCLVLHQRFATRA